MAASDLVVEILLNNTEEQEQIMVDHVLKHATHFGSEGGAM